MQLLASYLSGSWSAGSGCEGAPWSTPRPRPRSPRSTPAGTISPPRSRTRATAAARELGQLTFAQRGALLAELAKAMHGAREELIALAVANGGNTRGDAKFDLDGGALTLSHYAELGAELGAATPARRRRADPGRPHRADGRPARLGPAPRRRRPHQRVQLPGLGAVREARVRAARRHAGDRQAGHRDGAGRPPARRAVRPAAAARRAAAAGRPAPARLLDQLGPGDVVAFTGGSATARMLRAHPASSRAASGSTSRPTASTPPSSRPTSR